MKKIASDSRQDLHPKIQYSLMPHGKVLVVDDAEINLIVTKDLLSAFQVHVETVTSGDAAIEKIRCGGVYDIILMDYMMPQMDGIETMRKLREMGYQGVIIALTANVFVDSDKMFRQKGFDGFIAKPIDLECMDKILRKFIRSCRLEETGNHSMEEPPQESEIPLEMIEAFLRDAEKAVITLQKTIGDKKNKNRKLFTTTVHAMKSALESMGEIEASEAAFALEKAGFMGDQDFIDANTERFIETLAALISRLRSDLHN